MTARDIANVLYDIEIFLQLHGENDFKSRAYGRAARALETSTFDVEGAVRAGLPIDVPGVGKSLASEIAEIVQTGTAAQLEELRAATPAGLLDILQIRGLGAKKVRTLHLQLGVESLADLERAAVEGLIANVAGFGKKSQDNIIAGIRELATHQSKFRINIATKLGEDLLGVLQGLPSVVRAAIAGRLRRGAEEFDSLTFVVESADPDGLLRELGAAAVVSDVALDGGEITALTEEGYPVLIAVASAENFVALLHGRTGASDYVSMISIPLAQRGYDLRQDGLYKDDEMVQLGMEEEIFRHAGAQYIPPELREGLDEVRSALDGELPELVRADDLHGMLHVHSTWSDGRSSIADIAEHVRGLGYRYLLMTDHSKAASYANGLDEFRLQAQGMEIDQINRAYDPAEFRVLKGIECDILGDGSLDLSEDALAALDAVIISVHSQFSLPMEAQTERICRALENPLSTILGHSTGRLILKRKGYDVDLHRVICTAAEHGKSIELNCNPFRLDLSWRMVNYAVRKGVPIAINPDAHSLADFGNMRYGVTMARKGWLTPHMTLNALSAEGFLEFASGTRRNAPRGADTDSLP